MCRPQHVTPTCIYRNMYIPQHVYTATCIYRNMCIPQYCRAHRCLRLFHTRGATSQGVHTRGAAQRQRHRCPQHGKAGPPAGCPILARVLPVRRHVAHTTSPPDEKRHGFLVVELTQLRCQHTRQRGHQHRPLHLGCEIAHHALCQGVHRHAARVVDRHQ